MKKILCSLLTIVLLTACSSSNNPAELNVTTKQAVGLSSPSNTLITIGDRTINTQDFFNALMLELGGGEALNVAIGVIADQRLDADEVRALAEEKMASYKEEGQESNYEYIIETYGSEEAFVENYLITVAQRELLQKIYVSNNYDRLALTGSFRKARVIVADVESVAIEIVNSLNAGASFDELFIEHDINYDVDQTSTGDLGLIHKNTTIDAPDLVNALLSASGVGPIGEYFKIENLYYIPEITVFNTDEIRDEIIEYLNQASEVTIEMLTEYLADFNFMVHDKIIYEVISANFPEYLKANSENE